ncbi:MAG: hypothetical protein ABUT39_12250 [Acidobacteriota bacterium]
MPEDDERDILEESSLGLRAELRPGGRVKQTGEVMEEADYPRFRRLTFFSVLAGLCPLLPVPLLDDWALERVQRRMVRDLGASRDLGLTEEEVRLLAGAGERRLWPGFVKGTAMAVRSGTRRVLGKLFKSALYLLLMRDGVHRAVETFVQGYLFLYAARLPMGLRSAGRTEAQVRAVRAAVVETLREEDVAPIHQAVGRAFRRSFDLVLDAAGRLGSVFGRLRSGEAADEGEAIQEEEELLEGFVDRLAASLWGNEEYFERLERSFVDRLARKLAG